MESSSGADSPGARTRLSDEEGYFQCLRDLPAIAVPVHDKGVHMRDDGGTRKGQLHGAVGITELFRPVLPIRNVVVDVGAIMGETWRVASQVTRAFDIDPCPVRQ